MELHGFAPEFTGVSYGGPLNEAAAAGQVDVVFTADQPAAALLREIRAGKSSAVSCSIAWLCMCLLIPQFRTFSI